MITFFIIKKYFNNLLLWLNSIIIKPKLQINFNNITPSRKLYLTAIQFYLQEQIPQYILNNITINIMPSIRKDCVGVTMIYFDDIFQLRQMRFDVYINFDTNHVLKTIAHEMMHVSQIATAKWIPYQFNDKMSAIYNDIKYDDVDDIPYKTRPWEIDAYDDEILMFNKFDKFYLSYENEVMKCTF